MRIIFLLWSFLLFASFPALAQPTGLEPPLTPGATSWFIAVTAVSALGIPFVQRAVAWVRARSWGAFFKGERKLLLSVFWAFSWTLFMFQPGLLNIAAFTLLPAWEAVIAVTIVISLAASGGKDLESETLGTLVNGTSEVTLNPPQGDQ